jgi:hypothetical protein
MGTNNWYAANSSNQQGLICDESTGGNIAITYNKDHARLVAAAPELLEALQNALNVLAGIATGDLTTINRDSPAIAQARAVIAKARMAIGSP